MQSAPFAAQGVPHVAFYTVTDDAVLVERVLHGSMEPDLHLDDAYPATRAGSAP